MSRVLIANRSRLLQKELKSVEHLVEEGELHNIKLMFQKLDEEGVKGVLNWSGANTRILSSVLDDLEKRINTYN